MRRLLLTGLLAAVLPIHAPGDSQTSGPVELNEAGEPLKPNERKVGREDFDENYWGVHLKDINDEFIKQKGDETLFIDAGGQIFIKKKAPWYPGETGLSYGSTEEMLAAEKRWDELAEYNRKVRANQGIVFDSKPEFADPERRRLVLIPQAPFCGVGEEVRFDLWAAGAASTRSQEVDAGLVLAFDPEVLKFTGIAKGAATDSVEHSERIVRDDRHVLRVRLHSNLPANQPRARVGILSFKARERGAAVLEPLSLSSSPKKGATFLSIEGIPAKVEANGARLEVK